MKILFSWLLSILADVVCHYICKWLDSDKEEVASLGRKPPGSNGIEKPPEVKYQGIFAYHLLKKIAYRFKVCYNERRCLPYTRPGKGA